MNSIFYQIFLGSLVIPITILVQVWFIKTAIKQVNATNTGNSLASNLSTTLPTVLILSIATLWLLAALSIAIWIWAGFF